MIEVTFTNDIENVVASECLHQWDYGQTIKISGVNIVDTPTVHFANKKSKEALVIEPTISAGTLEAHIPNSLLAEPYTIIAYVFVYDEFKGNTVKSVAIPVEPRVRPSDYESDGDEGFITLGEINSRVNALIENTEADYEAFKNAQTTDYESFKSEQNADYEAFKTAQNETINEFIEEHVVGREVYEENLTREFNEFKTSVTNELGYKKEETLSGETKELYGLDSNGVPDDAFKSVHNNLCELEDSKFVVGDIKTTLRTDLGENWLLANGAIIDMSEYPNLSKVELDPPTSTGMGGIGVNCYFYGAEYKNDVCIIFGQRMGTAGTYYAIGNADGFGEAKLLHSDNSYYHNVKYDDTTGTWVMAYYRSNGYATSMATKDPINGNWSTMILSDLSGKFACVHGHNGLWVAVGTTSSKNSSREVTSSTWVSTTTDPINGTWSTSKQIGTRGAGNPEYVCLNYHNGTWVISTPYEKSASEGGGNGVAVYTTTDPVNGTWTMQTLFSSAQSCYTHSLYSYGDTLFMQAYNGYNSFMYTTKNPSGAWQSAQPTTPFSNTSYNFFVANKCLGRFNGKWYTLGRLTTADSKLFLLSADDPTGVWTNTQVSSDGYGRGMCSDSKALIYSYTSGSSSSSVYCLAQHLPTITVGSAYTYIKAKE